MLASKNAVELLQLVQREELFTRLIQQLNKDFLLTNLNTSFDISTTPDDLKEKLRSVLLHLIINQYDDYLNLLYRIDISEKELLKIKDDNLTEIVEQLIFVILKREYQNVWFKNKL